MREASRRADAPCSATGRHRCPTPPTRSRGDSRGRAGGVRERAGQSVVVDGHHDLGLVGGLLSFGGSDAAAEDLDEGVEAALVRRARVGLDHRTGVLVEQRLGSSERIDGALDDGGVLGVEDGAEVDHARLVGP